MTIDELIAIETIRTLRTDYVAALDRGDLDTVMEMYAPDAVCVYPPEFPWKGNGWTEIRDNYAMVMANLGSAYAACHVITNPWIKLTGEDEAKGSYYLMDILTRQRPEIGLETPGGETSPLLFMGQYRDTYRRIEGEWKVTRMELAGVWPARIGNV